MNRRPTLLAALALAATVTLAACGSDDDSAPTGDKITGADSSAEKSPTPSASASTSESEGRPKIQLPSDLTYKFEWKSSGDPEEDAVLHDAEQRIKAVAMAIAEQDPMHEAYRFYSEGRAAAGSETFIQGMVDIKARTTGYLRYYNESLTVHKDGTAALVYCEDQSKSFNKSLETGKTDVTPVTKNSYVIYATTLRKNKDGVWVTERVMGERGSAKCQP